MFVFTKEEDTKDDVEGRKQFAKKLASLGDIYVNDAFGTAHREHASTANIAEFFTCGFWIFDGKRIALFESNYQ